ncbi:transcription elongation factor A protein 2 isoform X3 [Lemur catta]|uniref:transcription elongation factor A protein 2 isoform X3 n=1 Tax=Lemur catta TaxID=9447 RepID=UPI001E26B3C7|nr:transcription elongation factor A protein 2 isoform X3 [Lemur catta]
MLGSPGHTAACVVLLCAHLLSSSFPPRRAASGVWRSPPAQEGAMDLLRELKAMPVTLHLLQSTRVGMSVNALRKQSSDEEVIALAKSLIKSWKKLLDASDAKARERGRGTPLPTSSSKDASEAADPRRKRPELPRTPPTPRMTTFPPVPVTCDAVRNKCREMLTAALQTDHDHVATGADCERLSAQIEEYILCAGASGPRVSGGVRRPRGRLVLVAAGRHCQAARALSGRSPARRSLARAVGQPCPRRGLLHWPRGWFRPWGLEPEAPCQPGRGLWGQPCGPAHQGRVGRPTPAWPDRASRPPARPGPAVWRVAAGGQWLWPQMGP